VETSTVAKDEQINEFAAVVFVYFNSDLDQSSVAEKISDN